MRGKDRKVGRIYYDVTYHCSKTQNPPLSGFFVVLHTASQIDIMVPCSLERLFLLVKRRYGSQQSGGFISHRTIRKLLATPSLFWKQ